MLRPVTNKMDQSKVVQPVHLFYHPWTSKSKGLVENYSLATSFREGGKNQKKIILKIGHLDEDQAQACRAVLKLLNQATRGEVSREALIRLEDIELGSRKQFLDCAALASLWYRLGIGDLFPKEARRTDSLPTEKIAAILTINRMLDPTTKKRTVEWFQRTSITG